MKRVFAPGCALTIYKPYLADKIHELLNLNLGEMDRLDLCCKNRPEFESGIQVINVCPGCDRRYRENYPHASTISLWEVLAEHDFITFPDYHGQAMSIIDACPTRSQERIHIAIRALLERMHIKLIEPEKTRTESRCCGDSFYGRLPIAKVKELMVRRAEEMPVNDVAVYCVSCAKSVFVGGRQPRYMIDLLFGEDTVPQTYDPDAWHAELDHYIRSH